MLVSRSSLILDSGLQLGRWAEWQGAPGPLTCWAAGPELGQCWVGAHLTTGSWAGRDAADQGCDDGGGWLTG